MNDDVEPRSGFGGVLRGSVNSMVGAAGLNLPLRAVDRLTGAVEHATAILERLERATQHLDRIDRDFVDRVDDTLDMLAQMSEDTGAIREQLQSLEDEVRELRSVLEAQSEPRRQRRTSRPAAPPPAKRKGTARRSR